MCLVLKLDNGKVVSIADEQTDKITEPPSTVLVYRLNPSCEYQRAATLRKKRLARFKNKEEFVENNGKLKNSLRKVEKYFMEKERRVNREKMMEE